MDLLRNCTSGVHLIKCFESIRFHVCRLDETVVKNQRNDESDFEKLEAIENNLALSVPLFSADRAKSEIWVFSGVPLDEAQNETVKAGVTIDPDEFDQLAPQLGLQILHKGQAHPSDLLTIDTRNDLRKFKYFTPTTIYNHFLTACLKVVFRQFVSHGFKPLNFRTFAVHRPHDVDSVVLSKWIVVDIDIQLIHTGHLRVFSRWNKNPHIYCLSDVLSNSQFTDIYDGPITVRLSPNGELALAWCPPGASTSASSERSQRSIPEHSFSTAARLEWKKVCVQRLRLQGIQVDSLSDDQAWATVIVPRPNQQHKTDDLDKPGPNDTLCIDWPSRLCFGYNKTLESIRSPGYGNLPDFSLYDDTSWYQEVAKNGLEDPLQFALSWIEGKPEREAELEARKARAATQVEEPAPQHPTPLPFDSLSPNDSRILTTAETQSIYPTPSDGLPAQVTPSNVSVDAHFNSSSNAADVRHDSFDEMDVDDKQVTSSYSRQGNSLRQANFGDDDDRYLGSTTLTDTDFDFFNQPEAIPLDTDISMLDVDVLDIDDDRNDSGFALHESDIGDAKRLKELDVTSEASTLEGEIKALDPLVSGSFKAHDLEATSEGGLVESTRDDEEAQKSSIGLATHSRDIDTQSGLFDDSKYSGGGRYNFVIRRQTEAANPSIGKRRTRRPGQPQRFSTSIFRGSKASPHQGIASSSDDDSDGYQSNTDTSKAENVIQGYTVSQDISEQTQTNLGVSPKEMLAYLVDGHIPASSATPLASLNTTYAPLSESSLLSSEDEIIVSQLVAQQLVFGLMNLTKAEPVEKIIASSHDQIYLRVGNTESIGQMLTDIFTKPLHEELDLLQYMLQPSSESNLERDVTISPIPPAHLSLQKAETSWAFASSAASFWETLGLEPASGFKEVSAYVIYPWSAAMKQSTDDFLQAIENSWLSHKLGKHTPGFLDEALPKGHFPIYLSENEGASDYEKFTGDALVESCCDLGIRLQDVIKPADSVIIYIINSFSSADALLRICECFTCLLKSYGPYSVSGEQQNRGKIFLQIVPVGLVASPQAPIFIDSELSATIAHRVYDSCATTSVATSDTSLAIPCGASIALAKPVPKAIRFQLSPTPSSHVLEEGSRIHVAYSESACCNWISAAWTDDTGENQHTAHYKLSKNMKIHAIIKEVWETTLDIVKAVNVHWRIIVAKAGVLTAWEKEIWHKLASKQAGASHALCLVSVETSPYLTVGIKQTVKAALPESSVPMSNNYSTPVSTPHPPQISSPAPASPSYFASASTPSNLLPSDHLGAGDVDASVQLIDKTDESWAFVLPRRLNVTNATPSFNPALASGYLMKRTGIGDHDPPVLMEVNLMHLQEVGKAASARQAFDELQNEKGKRYDRILGEILVMYRNLGLLARLRRIESRESCTPWHVAVAMKAAKVLESYMDVKGNRGP